MGKELENIEIRKDNKVLLTYNGETRIIGELHDRTLVTERVPEKHLMRKWNAYGFNVELIDADICDVFVIQEPKRTIFTTADDIRAHGRVFKEEDFEPQYFLGLEYFQKLS